MPLRISFERLRVDLRPYVLFSHEALTLQGWSPVSAVRAKPAKQVHNEMASNRFPEGQRRGSSFFTSWRWAAS